MTPERDARAEEIFQEALDQAPEARAAFVAERCAEDPDLLAEVQDLLRHYEDADEAFLEVPALQPPSAEEPPVPGTIGPYRLLRVLGEGGMGSVYLAEQEEPIRRQVALKLIKPGMDSREVIARFEAERQALALMDHPAIARVFDAGTTEHGRPYFVMEYVPGIPITEHCDRARLDVRQRVQLLMNVCEAVQHAHQRGVIHRDLKPSNVLVAVEQGRALPKVIDFGIAKATTPDAGGMSFVTSHGQILGTPEFMSPEQARLTGADVDTRTDVYSLGMILYLLLTGALPFLPEELRRLGLEAMLRRIREDESTRPSDRVVTAGHDLAEAARARRIAPDRLPRMLRGDLDWIIMKALEKDRERRYPSVSTLAADLAHYLEDEPVSAGPPSASYRVRKFARRHRLAVGFTVALALLVVGFAGVMALQAGRIARERDRANEEAAMAEEVSDFLFELFEVSDPGHARGATITAREILDEGAARIGERFVDQPALQARFQRSVGRVYRSLGLLKESEPLLKQAVETLRSVHGRGHPQTLDAVHQLAMLRWNAGEFEDSEALLRECVEARRATLGDDDILTLHTISDLGLALWSQARFAEAESLQITALDGLTRALGPDDPEVLEAASDLALVYDSQARYAEAEALVRRVWNTRVRALGADHPLTLTSANNLAFLAFEQGRSEEAEDLWRETLESQQRVLGEHHQDTLRTMGNLTRVVADAEEREQLQVRVVEASEAVLGDDHAETLSAHFNLGAYYLRAGKFAQAEPLFLGVLEDRRRVLGPDHPATLSALNGVGVLYRSMERYDDARRFLTEALSARQRVQGDDHPDVIRSMIGLAKLLALTGDHSEAERLFRLAYAGRVRVLGPEHPDTESSRKQLSGFLESIGRPADDEGTGTASP